MDCFATLAPKSFQNKLGTGSEGEINPGIYSFDLEQVIPPPSEPVPN